MGSLALRPDDLLTILTMVLSIGFRNSVSFLSAIQATGFLTLTPMGLPPTEHASLRWTHLSARLVQSRAALCASVVIIEGFPALSSTLLAFGSSQGHQGINGLRATQSPLVVGSRQRVARLICAQAHSPIRSAASSQNRLPS